MNTLKIVRAKAEDHRLRCEYQVEGDWAKYFKPLRQLTIDYSEPIASVPESILSIPLLGNILPVAWLCDATIYTDEIDATFLLGLDKVKRGYEEMYPMLEFKGALVAERIVQQEECGQAVGCFFSGGVDAYTTLLRHLEEKPSLLTLWGADIPLDDEDGWKTVLRANLDVADEYGLNAFWMRSDFRGLLDEGALDDFVKASGDGWWHGFQHGIGLITHAAPLAYASGFNSIYIASSAYEAIRGTYTCASDPTIDNHVAFCGCKTYHDCYEWSRQRKVGYLVEQRNNHDRDINLRVCWESTGGENCCHCEKCYRTILEIISEGGNPNEMGFVWDESAIIRCRKDMHSRIEMTSFVRDTYWIPLQEKFKSRQSFGGGYQWLIDIDFLRINDSPQKRLRQIYREMRHSVGQLVKRML